MLSSSSAASLAEKIKLGTLACLPAFLFALNACSNSYPYDEYEGAENAVKGFLFMKTSGKDVVLGTDLGSAKANERPEMKVKFTYNFYIQRNEVTCEDFNKLLSTPKLDCEGKIPATNMTFYDAALYANALSKSQNRDTVYTYTGISYNNTGNCNGLEGFSFHPESNGFRLPTEAEWTYVAKSSWDLKKTWSAENSGYTLHEVCSKGQGKSTVYDILGNAMEWVNDWLGEFKDTTLTNFIGPSNSGRRDERIVKGGSFRTNADNINLFSRGDVYTISSNTRANYVGFRLAYGEIPDAESMDESSNTAKGISSYISPIKLRSATNSYSSKLVFRNDITGNLAFIDYTGETEGLTEIVDTIDSYHPDISPDGEYVAFCTKFEGFKGQSSLYVRKLDKTGSGLTKLDVESAAIPRWNVIDNDTVIVYVTDAGNNTEEADFKSGSTWMVKFENGKFGTPKKLFDGAYHDGVANDLSFAISGSQKFRIRTAPKSSTVRDSKSVDTIWFNDRQICNVSLSKDDNQNISFLDFGGTTGYTPEDKQVTLTHERIIIVDKNGKFQKSISAPKGYTFDHAEWTNSNQIVATLATANSFHEKIVLVTMNEEKGIVELVEGEELWHPCLWVKHMDESFQVDLDSIGLYNTPNTPPEAEIMQVKMDLFWEYRDSMEIVIIGSSRSFAGIDPWLLTPLAVNLAYSRQCLVGTRYFLENYIIPMSKNLKQIILTLDYDRLYVRDENFHDIFDGIPGYIYDEHHNFWHDGAPKNMLELSKSAMPPDGDTYDRYSYHRGLVYDKTAGWGADYPSVDYLPNWFKNDRAPYFFNYDILENIIRLAQEYEITVVGVVFPQSPNYIKNMGVYGRYGLGLDDVEIIQKDITALTKKYPNFFVLDEYNNGDNDYQSEEFANADHLNIEGAKKLTERLDKFLTRISSGTN